jgi:hypothetical protein
MFTKVFAQIFDSSIAENWFIRHVFMDLLVLADSDGVVDMTLSAIARRTNGDAKKIGEAIVELMKEDKASRSKELDGRRLIAIDAGRDWGWKIVNYEHYRKTRDEDERRSYFRNYRKAKRGAVQQSAQDVQSVQLCSTKFTHAEGEGEEDGEAEAKPSAGAKGKKFYRVGSNLEPFASLYASVNSEIIGTPYVISRKDGTSLGVFLASRKIAPDEFKRVAQEAIRQSLSRKFGFLQSKATTLYGLCENWSSIFAAIQTPDGSASPEINLNGQSAF